MTRSKLAPAHLPADADDVWPVILFYKYVAVSDPVQLTADQRTLCTELELKGRLLIASEGINGTLAGTVGAINEYVSRLHADPRFADVAVKVSAGDASTFPKLVVKCRPEIVTLGAGPLTPTQDNQLSPAEWKRMMEEDPDVVLLDVRNRFESAAGRFEKAVVCEIGNFRDLPAYVEELDALKRRKVLMYCTGGIRCEKASALLRERGFNDVYQLHGGIVSYQEQFGNQHWQGECFVFDQRMTVRVEEDLVQIGRCAHTGAATSRFVNCLHDPCHKLFLLAEETERQNGGYRLCPDCLAAGITSATAEYSK